MNDLLKWIIANPAIIIVTIVIIIALCIWLYKNKKGLIYKAALYAVTKAEETWGSDTGKIKFAEVYTYIKKEFPIITFFFTEKQLTDVIEEALIEMKNILAAKQAKLNSEDNKNE